MEPEYANHACQPLAVTTVRVLGMSPCSSSSSRNAVAPSTPSTSSTQKPDLAPVGIATLHSGLVQNRRIVAGLVVALRNPRETAGALPAGTNGNTGSPRAA